MSRSNSHSKLVLEAAVSRVYRTLDLVFPGIEIDVIEEHTWHAHVVQMTYTHPRLGRLRWNVCVDQYALGTRDDGYVEYLMQQIPQGFTREVVERATEYSAKTRFSHGGGV